MNKISFPGLGIGDFEINRVAFEIFGKEIYWYGIIICVGLILAIAYGMANAKKASMTSDNLLDIAIVAIPISIVFARLFYVLTDGVAQKSFLEVIAIWDGGISIIGTIIGGIFSVCLVCVVKKFKILNVLDLLSRCLIIGQIIGRLGNFVNGEVYGIKTSLPWRMVITKVYENSQVVVADGVHPLFAYEMLWNTIGLVILILLARNKKYDGEIFFSYIAWYGLGRSFLELLRDGEFILNGYISAIIAASAFIIASTANIILAIRRKKAILDEKTYEPQFSVIDNEGEEKQIMENENGENN